MFGVDRHFAFFASGRGVGTHPQAIQAMRHPHFHDRAYQEAAWQAVVKVSGVISLPQQFESGVLEESPIAAELIPVSRISRRLRSYMIVQGVLRDFEITSSKLP